MTRSVCSITFALLGSAFACSQSSDHNPEAEATAARSQTAPTKAAPPAQTGPLMPIMAGQGVGAIRLGANQHTIERLMGAPCEVDTGTLCRYVTRGIDFHLLNGELSWIHVQRAGRPAGRGFRGEPLQFSFFRGAIPPDIRLGMTPKAVQEALGKPGRVEPVPQPNPTTLVERHYYPGLVAEYDRYTNGKLILGGVRVVKSES
jgi:hypothetical protein